MCGIAGFLKLAQNENQDRSKILSIVTRTLIHRGPDSEGIWVHPKKHVGLGFRRLAIIDLHDEANQPMHLYQGNTPEVSITFNGELFNYLELKAELTQRGHSFKTQSDTEVILKSYLEWGIDCFRRFRGMWAIALWDERTQTLHLTRDPFGIKPLYLGENQSTLWWASELKALVSNAIPARENREWTYRFLAYGLTYENNATAFDGITSLPSGWVYSYSPTTPHAPQRTAIYNLFESPIYPSNENDLIQTTHDRVAEAIRISLRSDVPLRILLSGGLDSSIMASVAARHTDTTRCQAITITHPDSAISELEEAKIVSSRVGLPLEVISIDLSSWTDDLDLFFAAQDAPVPTSSMLNHFLIMKKLHERGIRVALSGQGVDEVLYGYIRLQMSSLFAEYIQSGQILNAMSEFSSHLREWNLIDPSFDTHHTSSLTQLKRLVAYSVKGFIPSEIARHFKAQFIQSRIPWNHGVASDFALRSPEKHRLPALTPFAQTSAEMLLQTSLPWQLAFEDISAMAFSVEQRVPYVDPELMRFFFHLPTTFKVKNARSKWILRRAFKNDLPLEIIERKRKLGFNTPEGRWMRDPHLTTWCKDREISSALSHSLIDADIFMRTWKNHQSNGTQISSDLVWRILSYGVWRKKYRI